MKTIVPFYWLLCVYKFLIISNKDKLDYFKLYWISVFVLVAHSTLLQNNIDRLTISILPIIKFNGL